MELNYEKDTEIDYDALDVEWWNQATLARKYAKHVKNLRAEVKRLDERKKLIRSQLIDKINRDKEHYTSKTKPNATDIEAAYRRQKEYQDVVEQLLDAEEELDYAEMVYKEIAFTRKDQLRELVKMWLGEYFAGPSIPRDLVTEIKSFREKQEQQRKETNKSVSKNANMKRRKQ